MERKIERNKIASLKIPYFYCIAMFVFLSYKCKSFIIIIEGQFMRWLIAIKNKLKNAYHSTSDNTIKLVRIMKPFFTRKNMKEVIFVGGVYVGTHIIEFVVSNMLVTRAREQDNTGNNYLPAFGNMLLSLSVMSLRWTTSMHLQRRITQSTKRDLVSRYLSHRSAVGIGFMHLNNESDIDNKDNKENKENQEKQENKERKENKDKETESAIQDVLGTHAQQFSEGAVSITLDSLSSMASMATNLYCAGRAINNNTIIMMSALFALGVGIACQKINQTREKIEESNSEFGEDTSARLIHIQKHKNEVISLNAENRELQLILENYEKIEKHNKKMYCIDLTHDVVLMFAFFGYPIMLKFGAPMFFTAEQLTNQAAMDIFSTQMTWVMNSVREMIKAYSRTYAKMKISLDKIDKLQRKLHSWETFFQNRPVQYHYGKDNFQMQNLVLCRPPMPSKANEAALLKEDFQEQALTVLKDSNLQLLKRANLVLENGKTYRLLGNSGFGKSTVLKAVQGAWPYVEGTISLPCLINEIQSIAQEPFLPIKCSLLECLTYPKALPEDKAERESLLNYVKALMKQLNLEKHTHDLETKKEDWYYLSLGERQRIALLRALISQPKPKFLMMDEPTASIDPENRRLVETMIKYYLPNVTILYIEHEKAGLKQSVVNIQPEVDGEVVQTEISALLREQYDTKERKETDEGRGDIQEREINAENESHEKIPLLSLSDGPQDHIMDISELRGHQKSVQFTNTARFIPFYEMHSKGRQKFADAEIEILGHQFTKHI